MSKVARIWPGPAGLPFSRMVLKNGHFFLSGQVAQNLETGRIDNPDFYAQSLTVLGNILSILAEAGFSPLQVIKITVFLTDMSQKEMFDRAFEQVFKCALGKCDSSAIACTCIGVVALPNPAAKVEVELEGIAQ